MRSQRGFSLIELLIVVAIILIIAAIAVPNLVRSRMAANEASAAQSIRTLSTANITYSSVYNIGFALEISKLGPAAGGNPTSDTADLLDSTLGGGTHIKSGYDFSAYTNDGHTGTLLDPVDEYTDVATPVALQTGHSTFCVDGSSVLRKDTTGAQTAADTPGTDCDPGSGLVFPPL